MIRRVLRSRLAKDVADHLIPWMVWTVYLALLLLAGTHPVSTW